jgi:hypothetical protein
MTAAQLHTAAPLQWFVSESAGQPTVKGQYFYAERRDIRGGPVKYALSLHWFIPPRGWVDEEGVRLIDPYAWAPAASIKASIPKHPADKP